MEGTATRLAVSTVIFALRPAEHGGTPSLWTPFVLRTRQPHLDQWALPGGWLPDEEDLDTAAARTLGETTGPGAAGGCAARRASTGTGCHRPPPGAGRR